MNKYIKLEDAIHKRAESLADESYWEYGNPKNIDDWLEVAEMEFADLPTIDIVRCVECEKINTMKCPFYRAGYNCTTVDYCSDGERKDK